MTRLLLLFCILCFLTGSSFFSLAQTKSDTYVINIKGQHLELPANAQTWLDSMKAIKMQEPLQVIIQFYQIPDELHQRKLSDAGISLMHYIPDLSYTAVISSLTPSADASTLGIRSIKVVPAAWKTDKRVTGMMQSSGDVSLEVLISFFKQVSEKEIEQLVWQYQGKITSRTFAPLKSFLVQIPKNQLSQLAAHAFVTYVGMPAKDQPLNYDARSSSGVNYLSPLLPQGNGLDGSGVTVGVGDNISAIYHVDIRDRVTNFHTEGPTMHGIHTTVTVGGKGIMDLRTLGMAPSVKILNHIYSLVWAQTPGMFADYNMTITNNSYAAVVSDCAYAGSYDQYAQMLDDYQKLYPEVQHVFAAGNDGLMQCGSFPAGYATVTGGYQPAKNVLTVGGMAKDNIIWPKSARGPVKDGRLKPEITAYSFSIYSGNVFDLYGHSNGTSMSCPVVAGNLALIEQRYKQLHSGQNIPSDLLKALAMNGATDVGNPGPDYAHGYGLINTVRSISMLDNTRYFTDTISNGATKTYTITVPSNTAQIKVMLYWHDDPASPLANQTLINNLDLTVTDGAFTFQPWVLDPTPGNVENHAVRGTDNLNNSEQVTINNPGTGTFNIQVKGSLVPSGNQRYVVVYDFIPQGVKIKFPVAGSLLPANDSLFIYWDASEDANSFTLEYSDNNGASWSTLANNIPAIQRHYFWRTPNISSSQCSLRIRRNNTAQQDVSGSFVINPEPDLQFSAIQCPGYLAMEWNAIPNASGYQILRRIGDDLQPVDTVITTSYIFSGLSLDSNQYAAVRPLIDGVPGWRSKSIRRWPNDGNCAGNISDGDLMAEAILSPNSGRMFTSTALTANETLVLKIRNLDDAPVNNYRVSYSINGGTWQSQTSNNPISATGTSTFSIPSINLAATGVYEIQMAVENLSQPDPVRGNDTIIKFIRQLNNPPVNITNSFDDGFEDLPVFTMLKDSMGISANEHWDYVNSTDSGRLRSRISPDMLISGERSLSMDLLLNKEDNQNYLIGTFNLQGFDTATTEARMEFDYKLHGRPKFLEGNEVWVRGSDTASWIHIYQFDTTAVPGIVIKTGSLPVTHVLNQAGQNFSSSFQVRIGQHDTSAIAMNDYGNGMTIDNFRIYSVKNDVQLLSVLAPVNFNCDIDSSALIVKIYNSDNLPQDTVALFYRLDNGSVLTDTIWFLAAKDTVTHTFSTPLKNLSHGTHRIDVWLAADGDNYQQNDSILNYQFRNQYNIASFPYLENFETGGGGWYTAGFNSSWQYGVPNSIRQRTAASGSHVWATNLTGNYNDNEESYLYSPCFDISALQNPMLSFSLSTHIENCGGSLCDGAWLEYSTDGIHWTRLGTEGEHYNWYGPLQVWNDSTIRWHVASVSLPKDIPSLKLRFVMKSDAGVAWDGIAIDDIHIFDLASPVYDGGPVQVSNPVSSSDWVSYTSEGKIMAQLKPSNQGEMNVRLYKHSYVFNPVIQSYHLSRSYVLSGDPGDNTRIRLFITDDEIKQLIEDRNCDTCVRAVDAYRLGIAQYSDPDKTRENGSLTDNVNGSYEFIPYTAIRWVPYEKGYYAELAVNSFSEFWFSTGIPSLSKGTLMIFPNPVTDDKMHIIWHSNPGTDLHLDVYDAVGRKVYQTTFKASYYDNKETVHLPQLTKGVYTVRCLSDGELTIFRMMIGR